MKSLTGGGARQGFMINLIQIMSVVLTLFSTNNEIQWTGSTEIIISIKKHLKRIEIKFFF